MTIEHFRYPTHEEIDALVRAARRERAEAIARLFRDAFRGLATLLASDSPARTGAPTPRGAVLSKFSSAKERPMAESFWKAAAASLPPQIQWRYAGLFEAAERYELLFDLVVSSGGRARRALAHACRRLADALRNAARALDAAAWRLTPTR
ncbi:MAG TPA: hypothetical protein VLA81_09495 [Burkholderiales bacterium]|nr:hypothetical protein [Burkholderiales bacterium]